MIEQAKAVAQRLRDHNTCHGEADTIDALVAEIERLKANATATDGAVTWATTHVDSIIAERDQLRLENAKLRDTQYGSGIIEQLRSKIDVQEAIMRQALDALMDFDYDKRLAAIAALKEIPK